MSLIVYNGSKPPSTPPEEQLYSVVLNDQYINTLVVHNRATNEVSLASRDEFPFEIPHQSHYRSSVSFQHSVTCPRCGAVFSETTGRTPSPTRRDEASSTATSTSTSIALAHTAVNGTLDHEEDAIEQEVHGNYFKLLEDTFRLPDTLFTQGYFEKFFNQISLVGRGSRGSVYKVEHMLNGVSLGTFALKKITIGEDQVWLSKILKEVHMLVKISCNTQHLVNYNHVWLEVDSINEFGPRVPCAFILQQYCSGGNLEDLVLNLKYPRLTVKEMKKFKVRKLKGRLLTNNEILIMFTGIVKGVAELHQNHIIHRDLKPSNCLLSTEYLGKFEQEPDLNRIPDVLIGDFGESQLEGEKRSGTGSTGTLEYTAPELLDIDFGNIHQFNKKTDVYSLGMILVFMCFGGVPFKSSDIVELKSEIVTGMTLGKRDDLHPGIIELIFNLTSHDQDVRMNAEEIIEQLHAIKRDLHPTGRRLSLTQLASPHVEKFSWLSFSSAASTRYAMFTLQCLAVYVLFIMRGSNTFRESHLEYVKYTLILLTGSSYNWSFNQRLILLLSTTLLGICLPFYLHMAA